MMRMPIMGDNFLMNPVNESVFIFPVSKGETIKEGDAVVVNKRTLQAYRARKEAGYAAIGRAVKIVGENPKMVICKSGYYIFKNTKEVENKVLEDSIDRICYFAGPETVTLDNINTTKAGKIVGTMENGRKVIVDINIAERSEAEW